MRARTEAGPRFVGKAKVGSGSPRGIREGDKKGARLMGKNTSPCVGRASTGSLIQPRAL